MFRLERRARVPAYIYVLVPVFAVIAALVVGAIFLIINGFDPLFSYVEMAKASFSTRYGIEDTVVSATPLILTGIAAAVTFRYRLYNVGAEGQLIFGATCAAALALTIGDALPVWLVVPATVIAGAVGGLLWIAIPALARARLGTSEIITTLLLNYVAVLLARFFIFGSRSLLRDPTSTNFPQGRLLPETSFLAQFGSTRIHAGLVLSIACALAVFALLRWTRVGFEARVFGDSPAAARYAGIKASSITLTLLLISGAVAGIAGASEVAGRAHRLDPTGLAVGLGYTGIIVAALARYHPLVVVPVAFFIGGLANAASSLQTIPGAALPSSISAVLQGTILIFVLGTDVFLNYRLRWHRRRHSDAHEVPL
jgi:general nucleoside transport system permease protein